MNINLVILVGRLTFNPDLKSLPSGQSVTKITVATSFIWKDKSVEKKEQASFHNVIFFGKMAETVNQYFHKGDEIYVQGRLQNRSWEDKTGAKKYITEVIAEKLDFGQKSRANQNNQEIKKEEPKVAEQNQEEEISVEDIPF